MQINNVFYNLKIDKAIYFSSYLSSLLELKKLNLQPTNQVVFNIMIDDLYAMKFIHNRNEINNFITNAVACFLACGLNAINKNINIFCQSAVGSQHTYLAWLLSYISKHNQDNLLFCADLLMYKTDLIVADFAQIKNSKLAIEVAQNFNDNYKTEFFKIPKIIMSPLNNAINNNLIDNFFDITIFDENDQIHQKIKNLNTESINSITLNELQNPEINKIIEILSVLLNISKTDIITEYGGTGITHFKNILAEATISHISPIRTEAKKLLKNSFYLTNIVQTGNQKANFLANNMLEKIKLILGF